MCWLIRLKSGKYDLGYFVPEAMADKAGRPFTAYRWITFDTFETMQAATSALHYINGGTDP